MTVLGIMGLLQWLENSSWASAIRQSQWLYPILEIVHITGIVLLTGAAILFDLRLLGFSKTVPITLLAHHLLSWSKRGLILVVPSGLLLFITNAKALGIDPVFWLKMSLIVLAGINALIFHKISFRKHDGSNESSAFMKLAGLLSIILWISVITCGRLLAY
jgi:hypothetical protein